MDQFQRKDYFINSGGLNTADSPFVVTPEQATGGQNFDYVKKGGFQKRPGHTRLNTTADTETQALGLSLWNKPGAAREVMRAANRKVQRFDQNTFTLTSLTYDDSTASSDVFAASTTVPVVSSMFNTPTTGVLWMLGGGAVGIPGAYSASKLTQNGVVDTAGTTSASVTSASGGTWTTIGVYRYAFALYKDATGVIGNAGTDTGVTVATITDTVTLNLASLAAVDTTRYTKLYIFRSAVGGSLGFTTGDLIAMLDISAGVPSTTTDRGTSLASAQNIPRSVSLVLDNSPLPAGVVFNALTTFKRRLVVATKSTIYLSDLNKPESWPSLNTITVPSGGDITALAVLSLNGAYNDTIDELLVVFKQRECWVITGNSLADWSLKFIDNSGCPNQPLIVVANGYLCWVAYRGVYLWDGSSKPSYLSQLIEDKFQRGGDIDKSLLIRGFGIFAQDRNEIQWYLSSSESGLQKYVLKLDLRLTMGSAASSLDGRMVTGIFTPDKLLFSCFAGNTFLAAATSAEESIYLADDGGFLYSAYSNTSDAGTAYTVDYVTPYIHCDSPGVAKRGHKLVVWVKDTGTYDLQLDFWADYRYSEGDSSSRSIPVSPLAVSAGLVWDQGNWDEKLWDGASQRIRAITFNLSSSSKNNSEGDAFRFRLYQTGSAETVIVYGFTFYYTELSLRK